MTELDIFEDTTAEASALDDSLMRAEQSTSGCPEGFSYHEELDACVADDFKIAWGYEQNPYGIDLSAMFENRPDKVIQGDDGEMYRNNTYLTANGWISEPDFSEPVYFFHQPLELGEAREIYYSTGEDGRLVSSIGGWFTQDQIRGYWEADEGMGYFKEANPDLDFDTWFSFIKDASALSASGLTREDNPAEFDALVAQYGINTSFQNPDGDIFEFNGSSFTKTYKVDDSIPVGDIIMSVAIGYMTAGVLGPVFGGGAVGGAASGALGSTIAQGVINGKIDPTAVITAGVLGGLGGWFDDLNAATPGQYGGWVINGEQISSTSQWMIEKTQYLSNLLGIPFTDASAIVEGVLTGAVKGEDLEGIVAQAVGTWSEVRIKGFLTNTFGEGVDVDNWFREGDSYIPTEAFFPFVETAIQGAIDGGVSDVDLLRMLGGYFKAGGDLDFILPQLPDLDLGDSDLFDFCEEFPEFPGLCKDIDIDVDEFGCTVDEEWNTELGKCMPKVEIEVDEFGCTVDEEFNTELGECVPKVKVDEFGCTVDEEFNTELGKCVPKVDAGDVKCPPQAIANGEQTFVWDANLGQCVPDVIECIEGFDLVGQECVKVSGGTDGSVGGSVGEVTCPPTDIPNGKQYYKNTNLGECIPDFIECIEGFDLVGQECVKASVDAEIDLSGELDICKEPRPTEYGFAQINWDKYCKAPEITCPDGEEYNTQLGKCVPEINCEDGQEYNTELGKCVDIEIDLDPDVDIDLPSIDLGGLGAPSQGMFEPSPVGALGYSPVQIPGLLSTPSKKDYTEELKQMIARQMQKRRTPQ
jgi:hypothetical protein